MRIQAYVLAVVSLFVLLPSRAVLAGTSAPGQPAQPIPFVPFRMEELIDPESGKSASPGVPFEVAVDGTVYYRGTPERLLQLLNGVERQYSALGQSLRKSDQLWSSLAIDPAVLNLQLLHDLGITSEVALAHVQPSLATCPQLRVDMLAARSHPDRQTAPQEMLRVDEETDLSAADFVERINAQQDLLCALGWDMLRVVGRATPASVTTVMASRREAMKTLGISRYHPTFSMLPLTPLAPFGAIAAAAEVAAAQKVPTVLDLRRLRGAMPAVPAYQIPDLPAVTTVEEPPPRTLEVHKHKHWDGLHLGDRGKFAVEADGTLGIDATEAMQSAEAVGQASVHVAHHELRIIKARALARGSERAMCGAVFLEVLGKTIAEEIRTDHVKVALENPELFTHALKKEFKQRMAIGPVPVEFSEGVSARVAVGIDMAVIDMGLGAALTPRTDARAYVSGAVGLEDLGLAAGAGGSVTLLELDAPLQGRSELALHRSSEPAIVSHIDVGLGFGALRGRSWLFAKLPVPRWGLPPWKIKCISQEIFSWPGFAGRHRLIGWGQELSASGIRMLGDLTDQTDLDEAAALQAVLDVEQRTRELVRSENAVAEREANVYAGIQADVGGEPAIRVLRDVRFLSRERAELDGLWGPYVDDLMGLLRYLGQDEGT